MPLFFQHNINASTKLGVWHIAEPEDFFLAQVPLQQEISHPHKRLQHLAGRYLLRFLFPEFPHELIEIASTKKPFLPDEAFHFSISHCGDYAAAIVSRSYRVGIDIEIPTLKVARVRHKFLHTEELSIMENENGVLPATESVFLRKLTLLWSAKEAVFKWYGNGEVDFSDQIRIQPPGNTLSIPGKGNMNGMFLKEQRLSLVLPFVNFKEICLVWVMTLPV
ncbi:MAG TPA: 4'-phosphopantetheinyl transferase superfamily protein [Agriterribacter sp.]|uniref:4'-phosphopantetheinyl transferase family protein n=1 Tax=Agriterribacter sp. TaxID=2821509 RepID=UPI002CB4625E|nr:4'-phosphopantetheinyl transferase superfamily protein [Agriterribacter sp.]HRO44703.1 4'-phosphopantetheinyl transferase superfamily protein [Agriterribacter sp.]HRQ16375.1 4'-phosphopantetheinyl transferase superfamily protein [Agriterribacter sp.]